MDKETKDKFFDELMKNTYEKIYMFVAKGCSDKDFVEDVVQETYYEAYRKIEILMEHPNQMGWLYTTAKNKKMKLGKMRSEQSLAEVEFDDIKTDTIEAKENAYDEIELTETFKASISEEEYEMLRDYYLNGYSSVEVADKYGVDRGVIRMRMTRLKKKLKDNIVLGWLLFAVCVWMFL